MHIRTLLLAGVAGLTAGGALAQSVTATIDAPVTIIETPADDGAVLAEVPAAGTLAIEGCSDDGWCKVESAGTIGWVRADAVNVTANGETFVLAQPPATVEIRTIDRTAESAVGAAGVGAAVGAAVGGPVGGAVGAAVGGAVGASTAEPDTQVITYARENPLTSITWSGDIALGDEVPDTVVLTPVPETDFRYVYVDEVPVIVGADGRVVAVLN